MNCSKTGKLRIQMQFIKVNPNYDQNQGKGQKKAGKIQRVRQEREN